MTDIDYVGLREKAEKQAAGHIRMVELNGGIGLLSVREPELYNAMIAWQNASENDHADTVLALLDEVERLRSALLRVHGYVQGAVRRVVPAFEDQYGAEHDAALIESLVKEAASESDEGRKIAVGAWWWLREKARERREGVS